MCLIVNRFRHWQLKPKVAKKDISCYKVLEFRSFILTTPFQGQIIENLKEPFLANKFDCEYKRVITYGIHTYRTKKKALKNARDWCCDIVLPCYIPKGTKYWIGINKDYCSEKIMWGYSINIRQLIVNNVLKNK